MTQFDKFLVELEKYFDGKKCDLKKYAFKLKPKREFTYYDSYQYEIEEKYHGGVTRDRKQ